MINVKDFGALGNGTDDTAAIQAAVDVAKIYKSTVFFPAVTVHYLVTKPINLDGNIGIVIKGEGNGSKIVGTINNGAIFQRSNYPGAGFDGICGFEGIHVQNGGTTNAWGIIYRGVVGAPFIRECRIQSRWGIDISENTFSIKVDSCRIQGIGFPEGSVGILSGGHCLISNCDIIGHDHGIRAFGATCSIIGNRLEVNKTAMMLGMDGSGATFTLSRSLISGNSLEANDIAINANSLNSSVVSAIGIQGSVNSPSKSSIKGIHINAAHDTEFSNISIAGGFDDSCIEVAATDGNISNTSFKNISTGNTKGRRWNWRSSWTIPNENTDYINKVPAFKEGATQGKSPIGDVLFPVTKSSGQAAINTIAASQGGSLANGTYYYGCSLVTPVGETSVMEKAIVVAGSNNQVDIGFYGTSGKNWSRRIYRGTQPGKYDGYYDWCIECSEPFTDTGQPFDGLKEPPVPGVICPGAEQPDIKYQIMTTPDTNETIWITNKTTTGFTINSSNSASIANVDWMLIR